MNKYLMAFLACFGIFILWVLFQVFVAKGIIVAIIFCSAMVGVWRMIVNKSDDKEEEAQQEKTEENDLKEE